VRGKDPSSCRYIVIYFVWSHKLIKHHSATSLTLLNPAVVYEDGISEYMANKMTKATNHNVRPMGIIDIRFEVYCKDVECVGRELCKNARLEQIGLFVVVATNPSFYICHALTSLPFVAKLECCRCICV
jgi:hypothetical protein